MQSKIEGIVDQLISYLRVDGAFIDAPTLLRVQQLFELIQLLPEKQNEVAAFKELVRENSSLFQKIIAKCPTCKASIEVNDLMIHLKNCREHQHMLLKQKRKKRQFIEMNNRVAKLIDEELARLHEQIRNRNTK